MATFASVSMGFECKVRRQLKIEGIQTTRENIIQRSNKEHRSSSAF